MTRVAANTDNDAQDTNTETTVTDITVTRTHLTKAAQRLAVHDLHEPVIRAHDDGTTSMLLCPEHVPQRTGDADIPVTQFVEAHNTDGRALLEDAGVEAIGDLPDDVLEIWADAMELRDELPPRITGAPHTITVTYE